MRATPVSHPFADRTELDTPLTQMLARCLGFLLHVKRDRMDRFQKVCGGILYCLITVGGMIAIIVIGEIQLLSEQMRIGTEPFTNVGKLSRHAAESRSKRPGTARLILLTGQWGSVLSTTFAVAGSMYLFRAKEQINEGADVQSASSSMTETELQPVGSDRDSENEVESSDTQAQAAPRRRKSWP